MTEDQPTLEVFDAASVPSSIESQVLGLFDLTYDRGNHAYLLASIERLGWIAVARHGGTVVGFAVGGSLRAELPRLAGPQAVALAGIGCIDPNLRQQGLFTTLAIAALNAGGVLNGADRFLFCGRMAHPITYRTAARSAQGVVPASGRALSDWHREMLLAVATLYGVTVDPDTGVVIGTGTPIGYPRLRYEASDAEQALFRPVNRDRGDSLLAVGWMPTVPDGWA